MHPHSQRLAIATSLRRAADELLEASERTHDLKRFEFSDQLLNLAIKILKLARHELDLGRQPSAGEDIPDPPF